MDLEIATIMVKKPVVESPTEHEMKVRFEFENFMKFLEKEEVSAEIEIPEIDAICAVSLTPKFSRGNNGNYNYNTNRYDCYTYLKCYISLKGLNEELRTPEKYQVRIVGSAKGSAIVDSGFNNIRSETFRFGSDNYLQSSFCLSPTGSLVFDVTVTLRLLKVASGSNIQHNAFKVSKQIINNNCKMLDDPQFSDFKFIVKKKEFKVHRAILAVSSPVLANMFAADMNEARNGKCTVNDIEPKIFEHLLRFIYTGKLPADLDAVSMKLYEAAHYYQILQLKEMCKQNLPLAVTTENAMEMFKWASVYEENDLKMKAWEIIKRDILKIFLPMENEPPTPDLLQKMIKQKQQEQKFWKQLNKKPKLV